MPNTKPSRLTSALFAIIVGALGGYIFHLLQLPLPWTLGSLTATAIAATLGRDWRLPTQFRDVARPCVGFLAGASFSPQVVGALIGSWPEILYVASYSLLITATGFFYFSKICRYDRTTSFFASTPGGISELIIIGSQLGGNIQPLVVIHTVRVVAVVFAVPFGLQFLSHMDLAGASLPAPTHAMSQVDWLLLLGCCAGGYIAASLFKMQGGAVIVAMIASALVHATGLTDILPPYWLVAGVQVVIGSSVGARFAGIHWTVVKQPLIHAILWSVVMLVAAAFIAVVGSTFLDRSFAALLLAAAPGGLAEMTIVTYALGIDIAFVVTCHVLRVFMVMLVGPSIGKWVSRTGRQTTEQVS